MLSLNEFFLDKSIMCKLNKYFFLNDQLTNKSKNQPTSIDKNLTEKVKIWRRESNERRKRKIKKEKKKKEERKLSDNCHFVIYFKCLLNHFLTTIDKDIEVLSQGGWQNVTKIPNFKEDYSKLKRKMKLNVKQMKKEITKLGRKTLGSKKLLAKRSTSENPKINWKNKKT